MTEESPQKPTEPTGVTPFTREGFVQRNEAPNMVDGVSRNLRTPFRGERAVSSEVEHTLHTRGVTGSIPVLPTITETMGGCAERQRQRTVNPPGNPFGGSSPPPPTTKDLWPTYVYVITAGGVKRAKIGIAFNPDARLMELRTTSPLALAIDFQWLMTRKEAKWVEQAAHSLMRDRKAHGEWFRCPGVTARMAVRRAIELKERFGHIPGKDLKKDRAWKDEVRAWVTRNMPRKVRETALF